MQKHGNRDTRTDKKKRKTTIEYRIPFVLFSADETNKKNEIFLMQCKIKNKKSKVENETVAKP